MYTLTIIFALFGGGSALPTSTVLHEFKSESACLSAGTEIVRQAERQVRSPSSGNMVQLKTLVFSCNYVGMSKY